VTVLETIALAVAAGATGSTALITQTATSLADVAGSVFLRASSAARASPTNAIRWDTAGSGSSGRCWPPSGSSSEGSA
jgi:hypothetical protein